MTVLSTVQWTGRAGLSLRHLRKPGERRTLCSIQIPGHAERTGDNAGPCNICASKAARLRKKEAA